MPLVPEALLLLWPWSYPAVLAVLGLGLSRLRRSHPVGDTDAPSVSVVVTARNEARDLPRCLASLAALEYPPDRLQLVLVNDRSTDATGALIDAFASSQPHALALHTERLPDNGLEAKARGLAHGMAHATGEWILITDADAAVPPGWAGHLMGLAGRDAVMVGGGISVRPSPWWGRIEGAMQHYLLAYGHAAAGWGVPFTCIGPNMGIRRDAYEAAGGLAAARLYVAEDLALFDIARRDGRPIRLAADRPTTVEVVPVPRPTLLISQLRRWLGGGVAQTPGLALFLVMLLVWGVGIAAYLLAGWLLVPAPWWALYLGTKLLGELLLMRAIRDRFGGNALLTATLLLQLYQLVALVVLPVSFLITRRLRWVGDGYAITYR